MTEQQVVELGLWHIWDEGWNAQIDSIPCEHNPYSRENPLHDIWRQGWLASMRMLRRVEGPLA